jgi:two-component system LytT family response regulator
LRAFEGHALDYLTKPVEMERLQATLVRVRERIASHAALLTQEQLRSVLQNLDDRARNDYAKRLLVPDGNRDFFVNVGDIDWIEAADYYSCLHLGTKNLMLRETIKQLASSLDPQKFVRIHRSTIVNVDRVGEILREGRSDGWVILTNGQRLKMSRAGWQSLLAASRTC